MSSRTNLILVVAAFVAVTGAALAHVSLRMGVVRMSYQIGEKTRERRALDEQRRKISTELSMLKNPARLERIARETLGMELPDPSRIRTVRPGAPAVAARETVPAARPARP